jgi:iron complex outermembrane receptor protein
MTISLPNPCRPAILLLIAVFALNATAHADECSARIESAPRDISIPSQALGPALQALAAQTGINILYESSTVEGQISNPVHGRLKAGDALCRLLGGSSLGFKVNADRTVIVRKADVTQARLWQRASQVLLARRASDVAQSEVGQTNEAPVADSMAASEPTQIIVTGTRQSDRTVAESPVPIDVIDGRILERTGSTDTNKALSFLVPSFNFPQPSITGGTDIIRPATLRGLAPDQTLVLVNGKRRHVSALLNINGSVGRGSAAVDMSMLPAGAIERVEVLRDGAAAQYGSDALAGVINLILKNNRKGMDVSLTYGEFITTEDGVPTALGVQVQPDGQPVLTPDNVYALRYGKDRSIQDGRTRTLVANLGLPLREQGFLNLTLQARDRDPTNRAGADPRRQYPLLPNGSADPRELEFNRLSHRFGEAGVEDINLIMNSQLPLAGGALEAYAFGSYGNRDGTTQGFYRQANDGRVVTQIYPDGFLAQVLVDLHDGALTGGVRGEWAAWKYDASASYGRDQLELTTANSNNASLGVDSPTRFDAGALRYEQRAVNFDIQRPIELAALEKPLSLALGLEYRGEQFGISAGEPASYIQGPVRLPSGQLAAAGAQVFPGFRPDNATDRERHGSSAYLDLEADLADRWNLTFAARAEDYSDFGSSVNYKAAARYSIIEGLGLRAGVSTGFRAPSLHQQYFSTTSTNNVAGKLVDVGTFAVTDPVARALGAKDLKPERSLNLGGGLIFNQIPRLDVTVDYYRIDIDDRIVLTENLGTSGTSAQNAAVQQLLRNAGFNSISSARFFINGLDTLTEGVDVVAAYRLPPVSVGDLRVTAGYNATQTKVRRYISDLGVLAQIPGLELFGRLESQRIERGQPRSKLALSGDWKRGAWSATLRTNRYGEVFAPGVDPRDDLTIRPAWVTDLELRGAAFKLDLAIGAENLFDVYPDAAPTGLRPATLGGAYTVNNYVLPFSGFSPFGFSGRFVYGRATYRF